MIKVVCFDFGGVYRKPDKSDPPWEVRWRYLQKKIGKNISYGLFVQMQNELDTGKISLREYYLILSKRAGKKLSPEEVKLYAIPKFKKHEFYKDIPRIVSKLQKNGYVTPLISNSIIETARMCRKKGYYKIFSPVFISCEVGLTKSDGGIYKLVFKKLKVKPEECVMIDDNPDYLVVARKIGLKTILFKNPNQLKIELRKLGISL